MAPSLLSLAVPEHVVTLVTVWETRNWRVTYRRNSIVPIVSTAFACLDVDSERVLTSIPVSMIPIFVLKRKVSSSIFLFFCSVTCLAVKTLDFLRTPSMIPSQTMVSVYHLIDQLLVISCDKTRKYLPCLGSWYVS